MWDTVWDNFVWGDISQPYVNKICLSFVKQEGGEGGGGAGQGGLEGPRKQKPQRGGLGWNEGEHFGASGNSHRPSKLSFGNLYQDRKRLHQSPWGQASRSAPQALGPADAAALKWPSSPFSFLSVHEHTHGYVSQIHTRSWDSVGEVITGLQSAVRLVRSERRACERERWMAMKGCYHRQYSSEGLCH